MIQLRKGRQQRLMKFTMATDWIAGRTFVC